MTKVILNSLLAYLTVYILFLILYIFGFIKFIPNYKMSKFKYYFYINYILVQNY